MRDPNCRLCPLWADAQTVCIEGDGSPDAPIWIVGEAPGYNEDIQGLPFVGASGALLRDWIAEAGLPWDQVRITNAVRCRPPGNRKPTAFERKTCSNTYLLAEIEEHKPEYIVTAGGTSMNVFLPGAVTRKRGTPHTIDVKREKTYLREFKNGRAPEEVKRQEVVHETTLFPIIHPAAALYDRSNEPLIRDDLKTFARVILRRQDETEAPTVDYRPVTTIKGLKRLWKELRDVPVVSVDIEAQGDPDAFDPRNKDWRLLSVSFSCRPGWARVVAVDHPDVEREPGYSRLVVDLLTRILTDPAKKIIFHNGLFDVTCLTHYLKVEVQITFDTMVAAYLLDENRPLGLKDLAKKYCGATDYSENINWGTKATGPLIPAWDDLWFYNGQDTDYTLRLYENFRERLTLLPRLRRLYTRLMMPALRVLVRLRLNGMWVDRERLVERIQENKRLMQQAEAELLMHVPEEADEGGIPRSKFNIDATRHLRWFFFDYLGMPVVSMTPTGERQLDKNVISALEESSPHPALSALVKYRLRKRYATTYLEKWYRQSTEDGWVYPQYNLAGKEEHGEAQTAPVTGRLSGNYQQIPRDKFLRSIFGAPPGWKFIECDLSQIEVRLVAHAAKDPTLIRIYNEGGDVHRVTAARLLNKEPADVQPEERTLSKAVVFGFLYGMQATKFANYARVNYGLVLSKEDALRFRRIFFQTYPAITEWHRRMAATVTERKRVVSPIGRVRRLPNIDSDDEKVVSDVILQAINSPIQGFGSDLMLMALIRLDEEVRRVNARLGYESAKIVFTMHDAIAVIARDEHAEWWAKKMRKIMANPPLKEWFGVELAVPIDAEYSIGQHWKE